MFVDRKLLSDNIQVMGSVLKLNVTRIPTVNRVEEVARELVAQIRSGNGNPIRGCHPSRAWRTNSVSAGRSSEKRSRA